MDHVPAAYPRAKKVAGIELLADQGWKVWKLIPNARGGKPFGGVIDETVTVSVIHYADQGDSVMPIFNATGIVGGWLVRAIWMRIDLLARTYPWAEQAGFNGEFKNYPNSEYHWNGTNSNTFVRFLVKGVGLPWREMHGLHPGDDSPKNYDGRTPVSKPTQGELEPIPND